MKMTGFFLLITCLQVSANGSAQVTFSGDNVHIEKVFDAIKKQTGYMFLYNSDAIAKAKLVTVHVKDEAVEKVLEICVAGQEFGYTIKNKTIFIVPKETYGGGVKSVGDADVTLLIEVKGRVVNEKGEAVEGVSVRVKGQNGGTSTNANGEFVLKEVPEDGVLIFSAVNIQEVEWSVGGKSELMVTVRTRVSQEQEVKVVYSTGYQEIPKERATGSFVQINNELFNRRVGPSILQRILDVTPGLLYNRTFSGNILDDIKIRGVSTINSSKRPLLVIDNFIYDGNLSSVNVNDIASVTVLKDAAAASIWGARAGNGVIVLTTRRGRFNQKNSVSLTTDITFELKPQLSYIPAIPSKDIIALERRRFSDSIYNEWDDIYPAYNYFAVLPEPIEILLAMRKGTITSVDGEARLDELANHDIRQDIEKHLLQTGIIQQYNINISGGSGNYRYYGSAGFNKSRPNTVNNTNEAVMLRFYQAYKVLQNLEINGEINWSKSDSRDHNLLANDPTYWSHPYTRLADENGHALPIAKDYRLAYVDTVSAKGLLDWHYRPLDETRNGNMVSTNQDIRIVGSINYEIIKGLSITSSYQWLKGHGQIVDQYNTSTYYARNAINRVMQTDASGNPFYPYPLGSIYREGNNSITSWNFRGQINWNKLWHDHAIYSLAGVDSRETIAESSEAPEQYGLNPETYIFSPVLVGDWTARPDGGITSINLLPWRKIQKTDRYASCYANISYSYLDKYKISASGRIDKSNFFGVKSNDRIKPLWHTGISWNLSNENFYKIKWLDLLNFRATYGYSGNTSPVSPFATAQIVPGTAPLYLPTAYILTAPNPQLRWERVKTINLALDFGIKNNRLSGSIEVYQKWGIDLISSLPVDPTSGFRNYQGNNASIKGSGMDISINGKILSRPNLEWMSILICSYNVEKVTSYLVTPTQTAVAYLSGPIVLNKPISYINSYRWAGLDSTNGDALIYVDGKVVGSKSSTSAKPEDMVYSGRATPKIFGAFRNDFVIGNFSFSININYRFGYVFRRSTFSGALTTTNTWQHADYLKAWKKPGDEKITNVPGFRDYYSDLRYQVYPFADILIEKGDHIRLQDIRVAYEFKKSFLKKLGINSALIHIYANNLGVIWRANKSDIDPEAINFGITPLPKTIAAGLRVTF